MGVKVENDYTEVSLPLYLRQINVRKRSAKMLLGVKNNKQNGKTCFESKQASRGLSATIKKICLVYQKKRIEWIDANIMSGRAIRRYYIRCFCEKQRQLSGRAEYQKAILIIHSTRELHCDQKLLVNSCT